MKYLLALHKTPGIGNYRLRDFLDYFQGQSEQAWQNKSEWAELPKVGKSLGKQIVNAAAKIDPEQAYEELLNSGARVMTIEDEAYPTLLKEIHDPPYLLFYRGIDLDRDNLALAMIGARKATSYGLEAGRLLSRDLAAQGIYVVSGMARGIDSACHKGALEGGGKTIAVLGCGLDICYPPENLELREKIVENGAVISEFPLGTLPVPRNFPIRNRIISGLARGVVVIEAGLKSGTLHTVDFGLEQGRDIYAVPGPITSPLSKGTNRLLQQGSRMVTSAEDIYKNYLTKIKPVEPLAGQAEPPEAKAEGLEKELLEMLVYPRHFDEICAKLDILPAKLSSHLTLLEIRGKIKQLPGRHFQVIVNKL